jgi:MoxR-like ATPase
MSTVIETDHDIVARVEAAGERIQRVQKAVGTVIFGQEQAVERTLVTILCGGHGLLVGVPGLAKTLLVETLGKTLGLEAKRIQFTPDLMPSDIIGSEVLEDQGGVPGARRSFRFIKGPIFAQLLMADEINRASPKTQSALLQAMQEQHVTVAGHRYDIPAPFHVLATQNPLEQEGTYPLPEAQLDRFLLEIDVGYPAEAAERRMLFATTGTEERRLETALTAQELMAIQRLVRQIPVPDKVVDAILRLVRSARPGTGESAEVDRLVTWGPGPRASQALMLAVRAKALIDGRLAPSVDDVISLAEPVLKHRMALSFAARAEGESIAGVIGRLAAAVAERMGRDAAPEGADHRLVGDRAERQDHGLRAVRYCPVEPGQAAGRRVAGNAGILNLDLITLGLQQALQHCRQCLARPEPQSGGEAVPKCDDMDHPAGRLRMGPPGNDGHCHVDGGEHEHHLAQKPENHSSHPSSGPQIAGAVAAWRPVRPL